MCSSYDASWNITQWFRSLAYNDHPLSRAFATVTDSSKSYWRKYCVYGPRLCNDVVLTDMALQGLIFTFSDFTVTNINTFESGGRDLLWTGWPCTSSSVADRATTLFKALSPTQPSIQWVSWALFSTSKRLGREAEQWMQFSAKVKKACTCSSTFQKSAWRDSYWTHKCFTFKLVLFSWRENHYRQYAAPPPKKNKFCSWRKWWTY